MNTGEQGPICGVSFTRKFTRTVRAFVRRCKCIVCCYPQRSSERYCSTSSSITGTASDECIFLRKYIAHLENEIWELKVKLAGVVALIAAATIFHIIREYL